MEALLLALGMIILFFILFLIIKSIFKRKFCVLCVAVSSTWLLLLFSWWMKAFEDIMLIALLSGGSIVGMLYFLEKKVAEKKVSDKYDKYLLFRLPLYLTMISLAYMALSTVRPSFMVVIALLVLWLLFIVIFLYQHNPKLQALAEKLIACCKNW